MLARTSINTKWDQTRHAPREIISAVVFHRYIDVDHHEHPGGEQMTPQQNGVDRGPKAHRDQLPSTKALSGQSKWGGVIMVDSMESHIQPADLMMQKVPDKIL